jgi:hypothetical protein
MEKRLKRIEIGMIIIIVINIIMLPLILRQNQNQPEKENIKESKDLPREFNSKIQEKILFDIQDSYNKEDFIALHKVFSEWAQLQISEKTINDEFSKLTKVTGEIIKNAYSYYEYIGFDSGADWFYVYYKTKFENGIGTTKVKLRVIGANWEIVGINITLDEI